MKKYLAVAAILVFAACAKKEEAAPAADTTAAVTAPADSMAGMQHDTTMADTGMVRDSAAQ